MRPISHFFHTAFLYPASISHLQCFIDLDARGRFVSFSYETLVDCMCRRRADVLGLVSLRWRT